MSCQELLQFALCVSWREDKGKMHFIFRQFCKVALHHMLVKQIASSGLYFFQKMPTDLIWQCNALIKYGGFYQIQLCAYIYFKLQLSSFNIFVVSRNFDRMKLYHSRVFHLHICKFYKSGRTNNFNIINLESDIESLMVLFSLTQPPLWSF